MIGFDDDRDIETVFGDFVNKFETVAEMTRFYRCRGHFSNIWHYVIEQDGTVHETRPLEWPGCFHEDHNERGIGVACIGNYFSEGHAKGMDELREKLTEKFSDRDLNFINF